MRKKVLIAVPLALVLGVLAARLPVERHSAEFPEFVERWDYRMVRVQGEPAGTLLVRISHSDHRRMDDAAREQRAREIAELIADRRNDSADPIVVELQWSWHSDLLTRHGKQRFAFARSALN